MTKKEFEIQKSLGLVEPEDKLFKCPHCKTKTIFTQTSNSMAKFVYKIIPIPFCYIYIEGWNCTICGNRINKMTLQFKFNNEQKSV
jgi:transcription elongation factor Elf1